jgi:mono/diheme cytochrome c family protein
VKNSFTAATLAGVLVLSGAAAFAPPRTTLDGVYTPAQADRGADAYARNCARCHQSDLNGTGGAPALHTSTFTENWREGYLSNLFHHMQAWMPPQNLKGTLKEQEYIDILAYFLSFNEYPTGTKELTTADLDSILFVGSSGPQPLPPATSVRAVGCLAHATDWMLTRVLETPRVHDSSDTYPAELAASEQVPLGTRSFRLPDLTDDRKESDLQTLVGKKIQVKGVLNGEGSGQRITVFSLEPLDAAAGPPCGS